MLQTQTGALLADIQLQNELVQIAIQFPSRFRVNGGIQELPKIEDFFSQLHFNGQAIGVFQNLVSEPQVLGNMTIVFELERFSFSREVVEDPFTLRFLNSVFNQFG
jgi:hypothetical protein